MAENIKPLSLKEGKFYIDGIEVIDAAKLTVNFTPNVWSGKILGDKGTNRRWNGYDITGTITEYRTSSRWTDVVKKYLANGITPEFTVQGVRTDKDSDFYAISGSESVTLTGVVLTGDISLISFDADGDVVQDAINYGAKKLA
jgi:hypothetical protein